MAPKITVLIPTKNGGNLFREVLEGIKSQKVTDPVELLIVDSGSADGTVELARSYGADVHLIPPVSFDHGLTRNYGIELAKGDIVVLMTQDAIPANDMLIQSLIEPFGDPKVAGSYARQIPRPDADVLTKRNLNNWLTGRLESEVRWIKSWSAYQSSTPLERYLLCNFDNVCSAIRKSVWCEIPLRQNAFGEDIDWSKRTLEAGWKIAYQASARVIHSHDRPISYEYKRTYMCHRKLYELFGLSTVPTIKHVALSTYQSVRQDLSHILAHERNPREILRWLVKIPLLSFSSVYGQYRGAKDERLRRGRKQPGV